MSILLSTDREAPPQSHLDELSLRVTVVFVTTAVLTISWSFYVDDGLRFILSVLQPCEQACMNVYDPAQWSAVRWFSALLLGIISVLPLLLYNTHKFAKPGLLVSEYRVLQRWTVLGALLMVTMAYIIITQVLPELYMFGHQQHVEAGLVGQYSAVQVVMLALYLVWISWLVLISWLLIYLSGRFGLLSSVSADWFRWRLYGLVSLLMLVTVPDHAQSLTLPLLAAYVASNEALGRRWYNTVPSAHGVAKPRFDAEGRRRTYGLIDCTCLGAHQHRPSVRPEGYSMMHVEGLCRSVAQQEEVLEHVMRTGLTDVVVTGCSTRACPRLFRENLARTKASLHGLDLMRLQHHHVSPIATDLHLNLALGSLMNEAEEMGNIPFLVDALDEQGWRLDDVLHLPREQGWGPYTQRPVLFTNGLEGEPLNSSIECP